MWDNISVPAVPLVVWAFARALGVMLRDDRFSDVMAEDWQKRLVIACMELHLAEPYDRAVTVRSLVTKLLAPEHLTQNAVHEVTRHAVEFIRVTYGEPTFTKDSYHIQTKPAGTRAEQEASD